MWSTIAASVVLLPDPVGPVNRISPLSSIDMVSRIGGSDNSSNPFGISGIARNTAAKPRICWKKFTLNLPFPSKRALKSISFRSRNFAIWSSLITCGKIESISLSVVDDIFNGFIMPLIRTMGMEPELKCKSEAPDSRA